MNTTMQDPKSEVHFHSHLIFADADAIAFVADSPVETCDAFAGIWWDLAVNALESANACANPIGTFTPVIADDAETRIWRYLAF